MMNEMYAIHSVETSLLDMDTRVPFAAQVYLMENQNVRYVGTKVTDCPSVRAENRQFNIGGSHLLRTMLEVQCRYTGESIPDLNATIIGIDRQVQAGHVSHSSSDTNKLNGIICDGVEFTLVQVETSPELYAGMLNAKTFPVAASEIVRHWNVRPSMGNSISVALDAWLGSVSVLTHSCFDLGTIVRKLNKDPNIQIPVAPETSLPDVPFIRLMEIMFSLHPEGCRRLISLALVHEHIGSTFGKFCESMAYNPSTNMSRSGHEILRAEFPRQYNSKSFDTMSDSVHPVQQNVDGES